MMAPAIHAAVPPHQNAGGEFVIRQARIFDGHQVLSAADVRVQEGIIQAVAPALAGLPEMENVDGRGATLLPGLIDSHTHPYSRQSLRQALMFGVTTEIAMSAPAHFAAEVMRTGAAGDPEIADLRSAGTPVTAPGGHGTQFFRIPTLAPGCDPEQFVEDRIAEGSDFIKVIYDDGHFNGTSFPTLTRPALEAVVQAAHKRGKLVLAHVASYREAREVIDAGVDGLAHVCVDQMPDSAFGRLVKEHNVFVIPTLSVLESICGRNCGDWLIDDPVLGPFLSAANIADLRRSMKRVDRGQSLAFAFEAVRQAHAAGVPVLAGTDTPNPGTVHGASLHRELELLVEAGLSPIRALEAATSTPARIFGLGDRGVIRPGKRADLVLVNGDPTADVRKTRSLLRVWKRGIPAGRESYQGERSRERDQIRRQAALPPPPNSAGGLISDFDDGTMASSFGAGWRTTTDAVMGGHSVSHASVAPGGPPGSTGFLLLRGQVSGTLPFAWAGVTFFPGHKPFAPANLSAKTQLRFWARGDGNRYQLRLYLASCGAYPRRQFFSPSAEWQQWRYPLSDFQTDGCDITAIEFACGPEPVEFQFELDEVRIE